MDKLNHCSIQQIYQDQFVFLLIQNYTKIISDVKFYNIVKELFLINSNIGIQVLFLSFTKHKILYTLRVPT